MHTTVLRRGNCTIKQQPGTEYLEQHTGEALKHCMFFVPQSLVMFVPPTMLVMVVKMYANIVCAIRRWIPVAAILMSYVDFKQLK